MAQIIALPELSELKRFALTKNRYFLAALIYGAVVVLADMFCESISDCLDPNNNAYLIALMNGAGVAFLVGIGHVALASFQRSLFYFSWSIRRIFFELAGIFSVVFIIETSIGLVKTDIHLSQYAIATEVLDALALALFALPMILWTIWIRDFHREPQSTRFAYFRAPHIVIAAALVTTVALLSVFTIVVAVQRERAWAAQVQFTEIISLSAKQQLLSQKIANIAHQAADNQGESRDQLQSILGKLKNEMSLQASTLFHLVEQRFDHNDMRNESTFRQLSDADARRAVLFEQAENTRQLLQIGGSINSNLDAANASFMSVMSIATARLDLLAATTTDQAAQINSILGIFFPLALLVIVFSVVAPVANIFHQQYFGERSARVTASSALGRLQTYKTALDEHFGVIVTDTQGRILEVNKKSCLLTGYTESELLGQTLGFQNSGVHNPEFFSTMWKKISSGEKWSGEICNRSKDGSLYWIETVIFPVFGHLGEIEKFVSIRTNITGAKSQSDLLNVVVSNFPGGLALIDKDDQIVTHNKLYKDLLDLPDFPFSSSVTALADILRNTVRRGEYGPDDEDKLVQTRLERASQRSDLVYEWARPNGRTLDVHRSPIADGGYLTTFIDTTERRAAEFRLRRANAELSAFVKYAPVSLAMIDTDLRYVNHTLKWSSEFNLADDLAGQHYFDLFPNLPDHYKKMLGRCLHGSIESDDDDILIGNDGIEHALKWEVRPWHLDDGRIGGLIVMTENISERKQIERTLWRAANIDGLTGLANRRQFSEKLAAAIQTASESDGSFALGIIDIDKFKEINDTLGHDSGDAVLSTIANRLETIIGKGNFVARLGGDEFAFIINGARTTDDIRSTLTAIFEAVKEPLDLGGKPRQCSISCGVTLFPVDSTKPRNLLKNADLALYRAKADGRGRYCVFDPSMRHSLERSVRVNGEIATALETDALCLYFQPVVETTSGAICSVEALLRWRHPDHGILAPGAFFEALEDPILGAAIGVKVMETAIRQAGEWNKASVNYGSIAINVTSFDFATGDFVSRFENLLSKWCVAPNQIAIEVTEGMFLGRGAETVKRSLDQLNMLGVAIALDDFGTGYASLTHIKKFPINCLKIDRSFVQDMGTNRHSFSIVKAVLQLSRSLELKVIAEGIETENQRRILEALGCPTIQGYLIARPMPASEIPEFVKRHTTT